MCASRPACCAVVETQLSTQMPSKCTAWLQGKFEREAAAAMEDSAQAMKEKGDALVKQGNYEGAVNAYDRALGLQPSLTAALGNRAICRLKQKQYRYAASHVFPAVRRKSAVALHCWSTLWGSCVSSATATISSPALHAEAVWRTAPARWRPCRIPARPWRPAQPLPGAWSGCLSGAPPPSLSCNCSHEQLPTTKR